MMLTQDNLTYDMFENEDARLLILDVLKNTAATIYYYDGIEITVLSAIKIWNRAMKTRQETGNQYYSVSFIDSPGSVKNALCI